MKYVKNVLGFLRDLLPHVTIALAVILITCFVIDRLNATMGFIDHPITRWLIAVFSGLVLIESVLFIIERRKK